MLSEVLRLLAKGQALSMTEMARRLGHPAREVKAVLDQLENMGYIKHALLGKSCGSGCGGKKTGNCTGCSFSASGSVSSWILTERGSGIGAGKSGSHQTNREK